MTSRGAITVTASVALLIVLAGFTVADAGSRGSGDNRSAGGPADIGNVRSGDNASAAPHSRPTADNRNPDARRQRE